MGYAAFLGGGGTDYLYSVKAYALESSIPASGLSNDIAVVTSTAIPSIDSGGVIFAPITQTPTARTNGGALQTGDLWFATGNESNFPFAAIAGVKLYGVACFQWTGSAWVDRVAKIWYGGAWVYWSLYLYRYGNKYTDLTGGWDMFSSADQLSDSLYISCNSTINGAQVTHNKIDLTPYSTLKVLSKRYPAFANGGGALITNYNDSIANIISGSVAAVSLTNDAVNPQWTSLDISALNGQYYISVYAVYVSETRGAYAYEVKLI